MQWYYGIKGEQFGPVEEGVLFALARDGKLSPDDFVWNAGMGSQWARAAAVPGLFARPGVTAPPVSAADAFASRTHNRDLMAQARAALNGNWGLAVGVFLIYILVAAAVNVVPCAGLLIGGPLVLGLYTVFLTLAIAQQPPISLLFDGFKSFGAALGAYWLMAIFTLLWSLLLIVPGIIAALRYSMTYFILAEQPGIGSLGAIRLSKQMMHGSKWKYFCLQWRFFGWALLCLLTCGIGFLWLTPYMLASQARFYEDLRQGRQGAASPAAPAHS